MKRITACILIVAMLFLMASCNGTAASSERPKASQTGSCTIGMSFDSFVIERWTRDRDVFVATANDLGAEVNVQSANGDIDTQISQIEYFIDIKVDCIVVVTIDSDALTAVIKQAKESGIPVICYDRIVRNAGADLYISFDNEAVGDQMGEAICDKIGDDGDVVEICGPQSDYNVEQVMGGFNAVMGEHSENIVLSCNCDEWRPELAYDFVNDNIDTITEADAIMCGNDSLAGEVVHALAERGLAGKICVVGQDAELEACQRIVEDTQLMTVFKPVEKLASLAAECAVKLAKGNSLGDYDYFNDGTNDIPYIAIEPVAVTKENIDDVIIDSGFHTHDDVYMNVDG